MGLSATVRFVKTRTKSAQLIAFRQATSFSLASRARSGATASGEVARKRQSAPGRALQSYDPASPDTSYGLFTGSTARAEIAGVRYRSLGSRTVSVSTPGHRTRFSGRVTSPT